MEEQNASSNISDKSAQMIVKIFDLVMGRVFRSIYLGLDDEGSKEMERVFLSENDKEKEEFIKKYMPNFEELFNEEATKIAQEIKSKI